jgi:hypothetical protein
MGPLAAAAADAVTADAASTAAVVSETRRRLLDCPCVMFLPLLVVGYDRNFAVLRSSEPQLIGNGL